MLHVRFSIDKVIDIDSLSDFCGSSKHLSSNLEVHFFLDGDVLVFVSNVASFEFSYELINCVTKELGKHSVNSEVLSMILR